MCLDAVQEILDVFASCWQDFDTVCLATALHRLGKLELGRDYYDFLARQPDFVRLLTMTGVQYCRETSPCCTSRALRSLMLHFLCTLPCTAIAKDYIAPA